MELFWLTLLPRYQCTLPKYALKHIFIKQKRTKRLAMFKNLTLRHKKIKTYS